MKTSTLLCALRWVMAPAVAALLAGCGGEGAADHRDDAAARVVNPLFADDGSAMPSNPEAEPTDLRARTRSGRYATAAQAEQLENGRGPGVIATRVNHIADGAAAVELAVAQAHETRALNDQGQDALVLVRGEDLRLAAAVADRLEAEGFRNVVLVTL